MFNFHLFQKTKQPSRRATIKALKKTRKLLEKGWTKDGLASDKDGNFVEYNDKSAVNFCLVGSILKVSEKNHLLNNAMRSRITDATGIYALSYYNDSHKKAEVFALLDKAINYEG